MRTITNITIRKDSQSKGVTMFLTYNNKNEDYGFNPYPSIQSAINSLPKNDPYFPIKTDTYRLLIINGNKTILDENINLEK